jgi:hypothetical protein
MEGKKVTKKEILDWETRGLTVLEDFLSRPQWLGL